MAFSTIHDWLRTRGPFARGVELLKLHGNPSAAQLTLFGLAESPFSRSKLEEALRKVNEANPAQQPTVTRPLQDEPVIVAGDDVDVRVHKRMVSRQVNDIAPEMLPKELRPLREQLKQQWREFAYTRGTMRNIPDGMQLREVAQRVVEMRQKMREGWWRIEHWRKTGGIVITNDEGQVTNPVDLRRRERALSTWLSQRNPKAKNPRRSTPEQLAAKEQELAAIRRMLKDHVVPA